MKVTIDKIHLELRPDQEVMARALLESLFRTSDAPVESAASVQPAVDTPTSAIKPPKIGEYWKDQDGVYAGVARAGAVGERDYHLILCKYEPLESLNCADAAALAKTIWGKDFSLPTRNESLLLCLNVPDQIQSQYWHWTSTDALIEDKAWLYDPNSGQMSASFKSNKHRFRFVRRVPI